MLWKLLFPSVMLLCIASVGYFASTKQWMLVVLWSYVSALVFAAHPYGRRR